MKNNQPGRGQQAAFPRHTSSGNIPPASVNIAHPVGATTSRFPRASSSGNLGASAAVRPAGFYGGGVGGGRGSVSSAVIQVSNPNPDPWGEDDDDIWGGSEDDHFFSQLEDPVAAVDSKKEEEKNEYQPSAAETLALRRQLLEGRSQESGSLCLSRVVEETPEELRRKLEAAEEEKRRLKEAVTVLEGETKNLRNTVKSFKAENQNHVREKYDSKKEAAVQKSQLEREHRKQIGSLEAEVAELRMELTKEKMARCSQSPRSSASLNASSGPDTSIPDTPVDPPSSTPTRTGRKTPSTAQMSNSVENSPLVITADAEKERTWPKLSETRVSLFVEEDGEEILSFRARDKVFRTIERMVNLRFQMNLPFLESIVKKASREIMRRLVRRPEEIKSAFPDVVDFMFLWGIDKERKKMRAEMRLPEPPRAPALPRKDAGGWEDFFRVTLAIENRMRVDGVWGGLQEVRDALEDLLSSVVGTEGRVKMYERPTLGRLWKLLAWAEELWRCVVIEEDSDAELVERHKEKWAVELEGWTGIVLKTDWRDFFLLELEVEVRKFSLSILASIAAAGYFEQKKKRYVILGRILSDVLTVEVFAKDSRNIRHVLRILTFSVADLTVLRSLCHRNNEGKCLAKLLGDCVARTLKSSEVDDATKCLVYFDFLLFLETLMRDKPLRLIQSDVVVENRKKKKEKQEEEVFHVGTTTAAGDTSSGASAFDCSMDIDSFVMSQFACPIKYSATPETNKSVASGSSTRSSVSSRGKMEEANLQEELKFWLDPTKYEDPYGAASRCQCRRHLVACGVIGLRVIFDLWQKAELEHEKQLELLEAKEWEEMERLNVILQLSDLAKAEAVRDFDSVDSQEDLEEAMSRLERRYAYLTAKKEEMNKLEKEVTKVFRRRSDGPVVEWNWSDVVQLQKEVCGLLEMERLPEWTMETRLPPGILEECLSRAAFFLSFVETRSENIAAAMGSEAYKVFTALLPLLRNYLDYFDISRVDKALLLSVTNECEDESSSPPLMEKINKLYEKVTAEERVEFQRSCPDFPGKLSLATLKPLSTEEVRKLKREGEAEVGRKKQTVPSIAEDEAVSAAVDAYELLHDYY